MPNWQLEKSFLNDSSEKWHCIEKRDQQPSILVAFHFALDVPTLCAFAHSEHSDTDPQETYKDVGLVGAGKKNLEFNHVVIFFTSFFL